MSFGSRHHTSASTREYEIRQAEACDVPRVRRNGNLRAAFQADEQRSSGSLRCVAEPEVRPEIHDLLPAILGEAHFVVRYDSLVDTESYQNSSFPPLPPDFFKAAESESEDDGLSDGNIAVPFNTPHVITAQEVETEARPSDLEVIKTEIAVQDVSAVPTRARQKHAPNHVCWRDSCNVNLDQYSGVWLVADIEATEAAKMRQRKMLYLSRRYLHIRKKVNKHVRFRRQSSGKWFKFQRSPPVLKCFMRTSHSR
jgi:hypothetical protein